MRTEQWWYLARASGLVSWALVSSSVLWGLLLSTRAARRPGRGWLLDLHRFLGGLAVVFTAVHLVGLVADSYVHFGVVELLVPFASRWRPGAVAWGVAGLYLLVAVEVTSLLRRRLPARLWRAVHGSSFALFVLATVHAFTAGSESANPVLQWAGLVVTAAVLFLTAFRLLAARQGTARARIRPLRADGIVGGA